MSVTIPLSRIMEKFLKPFRYYSHTAREYINNVNSSWEIISRRLSDPSIRMDVTRFWETKGRK